MICLKLQTFEKKKQVKSNQGLWCDCDVTGDGKLSLIQLKFLTEKQTLQRPNNSAY